MLAYLWHVGCWCLLPIASKCDNGIVPEHKVVYYQEVIITFEVHLLHFLLLNLKNMHYSCTSVVNGNHGNQGVPHFFTPPGESTRRGGSHTLLSYRVCGRNSNCHSHLLKNMTIYNFGQSLKSHCKPMNVGPSYEGACWPWEPKMPPWDTSQFQLWDTVVPAI